MTGTSPPPSDEVPDSEARLHAIYERAHARCAQHLATIEEAVSDLRRGALDEPARSAAEGAAHRLAGVAGTIGFPEATEPARRLEHAFADGKAQPERAGVLALDTSALRTILFTDGEQD